MVIGNLVKFPEKGGKSLSMNSHHGSLGVSPSVYFIPSICWDIEN